MIRKIGKTAGNKKWVSYFYRTAQLSTLAAFPPWGSSRGAGRKRLTRHKSRKIIEFCMLKCKLPVKQLTFSYKKWFVTALLNNGISVRF
jgi:hypothetical protein